MRGSFFKGAITSRCIFSAAETTEEVCSPPIQSGANFEEFDHPLMHFSAFLPDAEGVNWVQRPPPFTQSMKGPGVND